MNAQAVSIISCGASANIDLPQLYEFLKSRLREEKQKLPQYVVTWGGFPYKMKLWSICLSNPEAKLIYILYFYQYSNKTYAMPKNYRKKFNLYVGFEIWR